MIFQLKTSIFHMIFPWFFRDSQVLRLLAGAESPAIQILALASRGGLLDGLLGVAGMMTWN